MKSNFRLSLSGLFVALTLSVGTSAAAGGFTLRGTFAGMPDSLKVVLVDVEDPNGERPVLGEGMTSGGSFVINGEVKSPRMCNLAFQRYSAKAGKYRTSFSSRLMADAATMELSSALPYDSLRNVRDIERHIKVAGTKVHDEFAEYIAQVSQAEQNEREASYLSAHKYFESNDNPDTMAIYDGAKKQAAAALFAAQREFIAAHPDYNISGYLTQRELEKLFAYTADEIDAMVRLVSVCPDTARVATVERRKGHALRYALNRQCPDFEATKADGEVVSFASLLTPGKYTFIDFWASWCGPCRAAIPHVRELNDKYAGRLDVYSVSVDETEGPWRAAMKKEQMGWPQLHLNGEKQMGEGVKAFFITSIPRLILLNDKGEVICSTNSPEDVTACLKEKLGD